MSSSVFKEYPSSQVDSNVVVFINKDGSVSVDQSALQELLVNDATETNTSLSVIRVESPTPSFQLELDEQEELEREMAKEYVEEDTDNDEGDSDGDGNETDAEGKVNGKKEPAERLPNVCVTVENFYNPDEAKRLASEILSIAGISDPLQIKVDYEFQRYVIANDHCYTPLTSPSQSLPKKEAPVLTAKTTTPKPALKQQTGESTPSTKTKQKAPAGAGLSSGFPQSQPQQKKIPTTQLAEQLSDDDNDDDEQNMSDEEGEESGSDDTFYSPSESENDRDSDLDFNVNDRPSRMRKFNRSRNNRTMKLTKASPKTPRIRTSASFDGNNSIEDDPSNASLLSGVSSKKKVTPKLTKKTNQANQPQVLPPNRNPIPMIAGLNARGKIPGSIGATGGAKVISVQLIKGQTPKVSRPEMMPAIMSIASAGPPALAPISDANKTAKPVIVTTAANNTQKKDKKPPAHVEALFSDIKSLFSTPDIIKKVGDNPKIQQQQPINVITIPAPTITTATSPSSQNKPYFMTLQPGKQRQPTHITVRPHTQATPPNLGSEQDKQLELIDSIVQHELQHNVAVPSTTASSMNVAIPSIVKMLEHTPDGLIGNVITLNPAQPTDASMSFATVDLDDADLLDGLANAEDGLTEDLLQHVAKLVEDKNLQEVIDKQVLGVTTSSSTITTTKQTLATPKPLLDVQPISQIRPTPPRPPPQTFKQKVKAQRSTPTSTPEPTKLIQPSSAGKEPIKIIRADGRVITLPPIEAPTTRGAKRRALIQPPLTPEIPDPSSMTAQPTMSPVTTPIAKDRRHSVATFKKTETPKAQAALKKIDTLSSTPRTRPGMPGNMAKLLLSSTPLANAFDDEDDDDDGSDGSYNSEDDPYRLWCICRQPHNNRFMICCDKCEDWFHGKCVNVTKAMGTEMEERSVEWVCPNCIKKHPQQQTLPQMTKKMMGAKTLNATMQQQQHFKGVQQSCIVCTNVARHSSIYCSDDCIRKHANTTTSNIAAQSDSLSAINTSDAQSSSTSMKWIAPIESNQHNRVDVYEKKSGRVLTGNSAPTVDNLRQWLQSHPTFEVVQTGSKQAMAITAKKLQNQLNMAAAAERDSQPKVVQTTLNVAPNKRVILVNPQKQATMAPVPQQLQQPQQAVVLKSSTPKVIVKGPREVPLFVTTKQRGSSTVAVATPAKLTLPAKQSPPVKQNPTAKHTPPAKQQTPPIKPPNTNVAGTTKRKSDQNRTPANSKSSGSTEPIRVTVQKTLREQLTLRMAETMDSPKLSAEEITKFAADTEREIYMLFNRDTTSKYRAKYRSLMFNIKDRKNETLFRKICDTSIQPKQLVRLSPEDLASQELAQWRENENKHQLEMIKKSELDLLACPKSYVLKTHKGEELIENRTLDRVSLDPSTSVRDVVSMLNNSTVSSTSEHIDELLHSPAVVKDTRIDSRFEKYLSVDSSSSSGGAQAAGSSKSSSLSAVVASSATKKKAAKRSRSHSREREQLDAKKSSSSASKHKRKRSRDRRSRSRSTDKDYRSDKSKKEEKRNKDKVNPSNIHKTDTPKPTSVASSKDPPKPLKKEENFNLIDKILEAQSTIDRILRPEETAKKEIVVEKKTSDIVPAIDVSLSATQISNESDQEPTSTVTIPTPPESFYQLSSPPSAITSDSDNEPIWSGNIIMVDVTTFQIAIRPLSGDFSDIVDDLPAELDVVGRIRPEMVWDYIAKIKKSPYKEILVFRFGAAVDEDNEAYATFYTYLASRQRFGVIKTKSSTIKDFYLLPLAAHKSLPSVLQPLDRAADFDKDRPDLLLGIIVKNRTVPLKRVLPTSHRSQVSKVPRLTHAAEVQQTSTKTTSGKQYTPPTSPKATAASEPAKGTNTKTGH